MEGAKRKLSLNLSFANLTDSAKQSSARKFPRNFEEPNGAVGLGILAAVNDQNRDQDLCPSRKAVLAVSPKSASNAIPILGKKGFSNGGRGETLRVEETDPVEAYTCVISHRGGNLIEKRDFFGDESAENVAGSTRVTLNGSGGSTAVPGQIGPSMASDFLNSCALCKKMLQGLDIFMYRGDMAFCSPECRDGQISMDEKEDNCKSRARKQMEYSVSPCSDSRKLSAGVAAA